MIVDMLRSPGWLMALRKHGHPRFANLKPYAGENASTNDVITFARSEMGGAFTWDEVARFRDRWKRPLVLKGILHPLDAERAVSLGVDGIWVSNHGGRQIEALPPADRRAAGDRGAGRQSRRPSCSTAACAAAPTWCGRWRSGAQAAFAGKAFLWGLGALGRSGAPTRDRSADRRDACGARSDRCVLARRCAARW